MKYLLILTVLVGVIFSISAQAATSTSDKKAKTEEAKISALLNSLTPDEKTILQKRMENENKAAENPASLILYNPTYIMPFYYTGSPYQQVYQGSTTLNQKIMNSEFKAQISIQEPVIKDFFGKHNSMNLSYSQVAYWQVYAQSQYFRETDYMPSIFYKSMLTPALVLKLGVVHQSNGRGGLFERSWNRGYGEVIYSGTNWLFSTKVWGLIFQDESSNLHNPEIADYLGYGRLLFAIKTHHNTFSFMARNEVESHFKHGAEQITWSFPLHGHFLGYVQMFSGYGQSLIEYDHYTNSGGLGIAFNDWI